MTHILCAILPMQMSFVSLCCGFQFVQQICSKAGCLQQKSAALPAFPPEPLPQSRPYAKGTGTRRPCRSPMLQMVRVSDVSCQKSFALPAAAGCPHGPAWAATLPHCMARAYPYCRMPAIQTLLKGLDPASDLPIPPSQELDSPAPPALHKC